MNNISTSRPKLSDSQIFILLTPHFSRSVASLPYFSNIGVPFDYLRDDRLSAPDCKDSQHYLYLSLIFLQSDQTRTLLGGFPVFPAGFKKN